MKGKIHSFQSLGAVDGPGVRYVVFMHGCNLRCGYCHNIDVCRGEYSEYTPQEVFERVKKYKSYFGRNGGVTVSGGEPLLQAEFVSELFRLCSENNIHTALDTSGSIWNSDVEKVLNYTDLVLLDIKMTNDEDYQKYIGCSMNVPLAFLKKLEEKDIKCWIRHVVVESVNADRENIKELKRIISEFGCIEKTELLPFRKICSVKYKNMNIDFPFDIYPETKQTKIDELYKYLNE